MRVTALLLAASSVLLTAGPRDAVRFTIVPIDDGASETVAVADIDRDGRLDVVSGAHWYHAPHWTRYRFRDVATRDGDIDSFSLLPLDVDEDGWIDLVDAAWFDQRLAWWRNPGRAWGPGRWVARTIHGCCPVEFAVLADIDGDGRAREIVAQENGIGQAWYEVRRGLWTRHQVSDRSYGHGIGAGDVNADGRTDILTPAGWLEAPDDPRAGGWRLHDAWAASLASSVLPRLGFMHVVDVDANGYPDVLTAAGHDYGVFWFEQGPEGWRRHVIDADWSQGHASLVADVDGDGTPEFVTGKRYMAHDGADPGARDPLGLYAYRWRAGGPGASLDEAGIAWQRRVITAGGTVGAGMQIVVRDLDGDGDNDIVVAGKSGLYWLRADRAAK